MLFLATGVSAQIVKINVCIIHNDRLTTVYADYDQSTGEKTIEIDGKRKLFTDVYPETGYGYAATTSWYINNDPITVEGKQYVKYGLPRILGTMEVSAYSKVKDVTVFAEAGSKGTPEVIYIPVRSGCEFQPYQLELKPCTTEVTVKPAVKEIMPGGNVTFTATVTSSENTSLSWEVSDGSIVGSKTGKSVVVSTKNSRDNDIWATATVTTENCTVKKGASVAILR